MNIVTCQSLVPQVNNVILRAAEHLDAHFKRKAGMRSAELHVVQKLNDDFDILVAATGHTELTIPALAAVYDAMLRSYLGDCYTSSDMFIFLGQREIEFGSTLGFGYRISKTEYKIIELIKQYYAYKPSEVKELQLCTSILP